MHIPTQPEGITAEWLAHILCEAGVLPHSGGLSYTIEKLGSDKGSTGHLVRVHLNYDDSANPAAPRSLIAKFSAPNPQVRRVLHSMGFYEREARFYELLAPRCTLRTPRCYFSAVDPDEGFSLLLLEDLSTARNGSAISGCSVEDAMVAVLGIAPFHAQWWQQPLIEEQSWLQLRGFLSASQMQSFFNQAWEPFLSTLSLPVTEQLLPVSDHLHRYLGRAGAYLYDEGPRTLIHNDYYADNLFFVRSGNASSIAVADWQIATMGHGVIDVARFLGGNLDPNDRRDHELRILQAYHARLVENGVTGYTFDQCWHDYRLAMLLPLGLIATVIGLSSRMAPGRGDKKIAPGEVIVSRYCRAVVDLEVGELLNVRWPRLGSLARSKTEDSPTQQFRDSHRSQTPLLERAQDLG